MVLMNIISNILQL